MDEYRYVVVLLVGAAGSGGIISLFVKGTLSQMKAWKDIIIHYQAEIQAKDREVSRLDREVEKRDELLVEIRDELATCTRERAIQAKEMQQMDHRINNLKQELQLLKGATNAKTTSAAD